MAYKNPFVFPFPDIKYHCLKHNQDVLKKDITPKRQKYKSLICLDQEISADSFCSTVLGILQHKFYGHLDCLNRKCIGAD